MNMKQMIADVKSRGYKPIQNGRDMRYTLDLTDPVTGEAAGQREVIVHPGRYHPNNGPVIFFSVTVNEWGPDGDVVNSYCGHFGRQGKALNADAREIRAAVKNAFLIHSGSE